MDFTLRKYQCLITDILEKRYQPITFADYMRGERPERFVILRHDVDLRPDNSWATSKIEKEAGVKASYYFRAVPESWNEGIIRDISAIGHEVGYHYESLATCKGDLTAALKDFEGNLTRLRELVPVDTICMHGSPRSPYDSRDLWEEASYHNLGIPGEPYFDVGFSDVFYLTDTGRRWDGFRVSIRDWIPKYQDRWCTQGLVYHSTEDIIRALEIDSLPPRVMITTHPQRWTDSPIPWMKECVM